MDDEVEHNITNVEDSACFVVHRYSTYKKRCPGNVMSLSAFNGNLDVLY